MTRSRLSARAHGLYAITLERYPDAPRLLAESAAVLAGGVALLQFRDKSGDAGWRSEVGRALATLCAGAGVPLIINDDIALAARLGAAGVHLGREDAAVAEARRQLGVSALVGVSCYDRIGLAQAAVGAGASYLAFGSVYPSRTKPGAVHCPLAVITAARQWGLPLVAIGGITPENGRAVIEAGADYLAVAGALFDAADPAAVVRQFNDLWLSRNRHEP